MTRFREPVPTPRPRRRTGVVTPYRAAVRAAPPYTRLRGPAFRISEATRSKDAARQTVGATDRRTNAVQQEFRVPAAEERLGGAEVMDCRGVQIGEHNMQVNTFDFKVSRVDIDWEKAFQRSGVQHALDRLAADPNNSRLRAKADAALGRSAFFASAPQVRTEQGDLVASTERSKGVLGVFCVRNSSGVQQGDNNRQDNTFVYVTSTRLDARQVLHDEPEVRRAVIDSVVGPQPKAGREELARSVGQAVSSAVLGAGAPRGLGTRATTRPRAVAVVRGKDGVSIGRTSRQRNEARVRGAEAAFPPPQVGRAVDRTAAARAASPQRVAARAVTARAERSSVSPGGEAHAREQERGWEVVRRRFAVSERAATEREGFGVRAPTRGRGAIGSIGPR